MKSNRESGARPQEKNTTHSRPAKTTGSSTLPSIGSRTYAIGFGLFLGLCIIKFGNPVILDQKITPPADLAEAWRFGWPVHWAYAVFLVFALAGGWMIVSVRPRWPATRWLWILPSIWFGWQLISASRSVDVQLSEAVLWQFGCCLAAYFLAALLFARPNGMRWLLVGLLAAFAFCLVRAANQKLFEFPQEQQLLINGERTGWTNFSPEVFFQMKHDNIVISTNGVDAVNPVILAKYSKGRVMGTLVYPNALAGLIILLWPLSLVLAFNNTHRLRATTRIVVICLTLFLGGAGLFWTGSKLGWLIAVLLAGLWFLRSNKPGPGKYIFLICVILAGLAVFIIRFQSYFAAGATSVGARFDYWRAAVSVAREEPFWGSGPGTFQRPYARIKSPEAEMTRLVHNDYLEQFSDSGIPGGVSYTIWILLSLLVLGRRLWRSADLLLFAVYLGLLGWFLQGLGEFSLYIPALAWSAFTLLGWLIGHSANENRQIPQTGL